jgi:murein DD-endopeptidase MepM/ murein hydrolase activator NlpD
VRGGPIASGVVVGLAAGVGVIISVWLSAAGEKSSSAAGTVATARASLRAPFPGTASDVERLRARGLALPVAGLDPRSLRDSFADPREGGPHAAVDILAPRGTPVLAVEDGVVARLFTSRRGGIAVYLFDPDATYCYYYAHLDGYAPGLKEGAAVRRGDVLGFVGTTGNAPPQTPHLHFAIQRLGSPPRWSQGTPVNPYSVFVTAG